MAACILGVVVPIDKELYSNDVVNFLNIIGKIESTWSVGLTLTIPKTDIIFEHIFLWDKQTPLAFPVVPEVNNKKCKSSECQLF